MTLDEILREAERLDRGATLGESRRFYALHGPRLVAAVRAGMEMRRGMPGSAAHAMAVAAWDAAASGEGKR